MRWIEEVAPACVQFLLRNNDAIQSCNNQIPSVVETPRVFFCYGQNGLKCPKGTFNDNINENLLIIYLVLFINLFFY